VVVRRGQGRRESHSRQVGRIVADGDANRPPAESPPVGTRASPRSPRSGRRAPGRSRCSGADPGARATANATSPRRQPVSNRNRMIASSRRSSKGSPRQAARSRGPGRSQGQAPGPPPPWGAAGPSWGSARCRARRPPAGSGAGRLGRQGQPGRLWRGAGVRHDAERPGGRWTPSIFTGRMTTPAARSGAPTWTARAWSAASSPASKTRVDWRSPVPDPLRATATIVYAIHQVPAWRLFASPSSASRWPTMPRWLAPKGLRDSAFGL
jgi:hypothetical protein